MPEHRLRLKVLAGEVAIWQCDPARLCSLDLAQMRGVVASVALTGAELSGVCAAETVPEDASQISRGWAVLRVEQPHDLSVTGVLSSVARPLADAGIAIFAISTYDTDHILVGTAEIGRAVDALTGAGHDVSR